MGEELLDLNQDLNESDSKSNRVGQLLLNLIPLILGGIVLWVGQTTFQHNGLISGLQHQIKAVDDRNEARSPAFCELTVKVNVKKKDGVEGLILQLPPRLDLELLQHSMIRPHCVFGTNLIIRNSARNNPGGNYSIAEAFRTVAYALRVYALPEDALAGEWKVSVDFEGIVYEHSFTVTGATSVPAFGEGSPGLPP